MDPARILGKARAMTYQLYIGNRLYFSWSLAAYMMFEKFGLRDHVKTTEFRPEAENGVRPLMTDLAPARTLPTVIAPDGAVVNDSFAIAEELASRHPDIPFWPADPLARGTARALAAEMHSSFGTLRGSWHMNLRQAYAPQAEPPAVTAELDRLEELWSHARAVTKPQDPWLCGEFSLVDAIFAPMAARLAIYGFDSRPVTKSYVSAHLSDPAFRRWRAMGLANVGIIPECERDYEIVPWPGPKPLKARAVADGVGSVNETCPYSGDPVTDFLEFDGRVFGFCNAFCRDKTVADPEAWPAFMALT